MIQEQSIKLNLELPKGDVNRQMEVFYNPIMISNRNISILLLNSIPNTKMNIADPLAGSGIRSLRFLKELKKGKIQQLFVNDFKEDFVKKFKENLKLNDLDQKQIYPKQVVSGKNLLDINSEEANLFLLNRNGFDYIEVDPFGSPNPFLNSAINRLSREGILAVTATDTAALTGTYLKVTKRKYWATSLRNYMMHETGLRILIRKVQLQGVQFDKALTPILAYHKDHYFRVYFQCEKSKDKCDIILKQELYLLFCSNCLNFKSSEFNNEICSCKKKFLYVGPLWSGKLFDSDLLKKMKQENVFPEEEKFLELLLNESKKDLLGFYDMHQISEKLKVNPPKLEEIMKKLKAVRTHFSPTGIKTEKSIEAIEKLFEKKKNNDNN